MALARTVLSLRSAWSSAAPLAARSFSDAAQGPLSTAAESEGAKAALFRILGQAQEPLTSAQVWEAAEQAGLKSKRFTKRMLQELRLAGWVKTQPLAHSSGSSGSKKAARNYGYRLNQHMQQQRQVRLEQRSGQAAL